MCEIKYHVKLPIFVARQWIRHRTANVNEYSAPIPSSITSSTSRPGTSRPGTTNRQAAASLEGDAARRVLDLLREEQRARLCRHAEMLNEDPPATPPTRLPGLARELAR